MLFFASGQVSPDNSGSRKFSFVRLSIESPNISPGLQAWALARSSSIPILSEN